MSTSGPESESEGVEAALAQEVLSELDAEFAELEAEIQRIGELSATAAPEKVALLEELRRKWKERLASKSKEDEAEKPQWRKLVDAALESAIGEVLDDQEVDIDGNLAFRVDNETLQRHGPKVMQALAAGLGDALTKGGVRLNPSGTTDQPESGAQQLMRQVLGGLGTAFGKGLSSVAKDGLKPKASEASEASETPPKGEATPEATEPAPKPEPESEPKPEPEPETELELEDPATVLLNRLDLEQLEEGLFRGYPPNTGRPQIFGGLVAAQAMLAAARTVSDPERQAHSLHAYFLQEGDPAEPIDYEVRNVRDGGSFSTRRVEAVQGGTTIFATSVSFHRPEPGMAHQVPMPDTPPPEDLQTHEERLAGYAERSPHNLVFKYLLREEQPLDRRALDPTDLVAPEPRRGLKRVWFKAAGNLPDDPAIHRAALTYASDYGLVTNGIEVHGVSWLDTRIIVASLDHALWFHRPFRADEWLLFVSESPSADSGRGFNMGRIYRRDGILVASVAQEGLMRIKTPRPA